MTTPINKEKPDTDATSGRCGANCSVCPTCGDEFMWTVYDGHRKPRPTKYCSHECRWKNAKLNRVKKCPCCGKSFNAEDKRGKRNMKQKYCSRSCAAKETVSMDNLKSVGVPQGLGHHAEKGWRLRSPRNVTYKFKNLGVFIRSHKELFTNQELEIRSDGRTVAERGLRVLSPRRKHVKAGWKGWTWVSQTERIHNDGDDILERPSISPNVKDSGS